MNEADWYITRASASAIYRQTAERAARFVDEASQGCDLLLEGGADRAEIEAYLVEARRRYHLSFEAWLSEALAAARVPND